MRCQKKLLGLLAGIFDVVCNVGFLSATWSIGCLRYMYTDFVNGVSPLFLFCLLIVISCFLLSLCVCLYSDVVDSVARSG